MSSLNGAGPPWPSYLGATNGALPEFVRVLKSNGASRWVPANPKKKDDAPGFYFRARIDFDVVADGHVIDSQKLHLPPGLRVQNDPVD